MRTKIIKIGAGIIFLFIASGIINLSVFKGRELKNLSNKNCIRLVPQEGARGRILDRGGEVIVDNYLAYDCLVLPQDRAQIDKTIDAAAKVLEISFKEAKSRFNSGYSAPFLPVALQKNIDVKKAIALEELKLDFPAIIVQPRPLRKYIYSGLASHLIGYLSEIDLWRLSKLSDYGYNSKDTVGFGGVEEKYDYFLRQQQGAFSVQVDHRGRLVRVLGYKPPKNGKDIQLTLDLRIQKIVEECLRGRKGCVIIMEPDSGAIVAMASEPSFNPAAFISKTGFSNFFKDRDAPLLNRAISGLYPPGSVFKSVVASGALETGKIDLSTTYNCSGSTLIGNRHFKCWDTHGKQDLRNAIAHSCDIFFYKSGILLGPQAIHDYAVKFGFSRLTNIDLPYEQNGFVPDPLWKKVSRLQNWYNGDTANFSIGQGDLMVTPLQVVRMTAVFANGGYLVKPYVVSSIGGFDISSSQKKAVKVPVKDFAMNYVRQGLGKVVSDPSGTASVLSGMGISIAGKTGTVQVPRGQSHAWFAGYFPAIKPKYVVCTFLEHGGSGYASTVLTKQIIDAMMREGAI